MKKQLMKFSLLALLALLTIGCSKSDDSNDTDGAADGELIAKIDGNQFRATTQVGASLYNGTFNITAIQPSTNETIVITVTNASQGTFDLGPSTNAQGVGVYMINGENAFGSATENGSGKINITNLDVTNKTVSGTFNFTATRDIIVSNGDIITEVVQVTEGAFNNITLSTSITGNGNSTLSAKIDGADLNADSVRAFESTLGGSSTIAITANNNSTKQNLGLTFPGTITPGTYNFSGPFSTYTATYNPNLGGGTNVYAAENGTLKITSYDASTKIIKGTFSFTAKRLDPNDPDVTYQVTSGSFSVEVE